MKTNRWDDHYARRAREEKWLARSVYKLQEIDSKYKIIRRGERILDLGCYPGSWSQYGIKKVGPQGQVAGIDLFKPVQISSPNYIYIQADVLAIDVEWLINELGPRDAVISDLAPQTTGVRSMDASRSILLARRAGDIAAALLRDGGRFVCKVFEGEDVRELKSWVSYHFKQVRLFRPKATRKRSREVYIIGLDLVEH
ncbi:MAG TPA: RlmE family RNA methyltransferase [Desulfobacteraceae bacterium]|nr:RlmE family RNA methyltransferase [Desulfobacteraceae bacterium]HPJ68551.1 RlmE family RNA methyltransferase [Desulfobacteraceae bacterium]HPQ28691.1 RlmE family RNA methyltransferase [Desulfobacteraceae bacterium]